MTQIYIYGILLVAAEVAAFITADRLGLFGEVEG